MTTPVNVWMYVIEFVDRPQKEITVGDSGERINITDSGVEHVKAPGVWTLYPWHTITTISRYAHY